MPTSGHGRAPGSGSTATARLTDTVDVWLERVDAPDDLATLTAQLDEDEAARAGRFRFERDRVRFIARRAFLRRVLASATGIPPARIRYRLTAAGRPELDPRLGIAFSASHADGLAAVAVARDRLVGVDIERVRPIPDALDLARDVCSRSEAERLLAEDQANRDEAFLRLWTRKEAYVKALGVGLAMPLFEVDVGEDDGRPVQPRGAEQPFWFASLAGQAGYVGALAASGPRPLIRAQLGQGAWS